MSGIHEEVFRESTAKRRVEALFGGKLWRDGRWCTTKLQGLREMSGNHKEVFRESTAGRKTSRVVSGNIKPKHWRDLYYWRNLYQWRNLYKYKWRNQK